MARIKPTHSPLLVVTLLAGLGGYILGCTPPKPEAESQAPAEQAEAAADNEQATKPDQTQADPGTASKYSPVKARARDFYAPNTEDLGPDEMRLIACGTGMPTARPKQAASCWLLELGNGDKFIFDIGTGSNERIAALQIPYNYLDKVFLSHLHTDHFGDWGNTGERHEVRARSSTESAHLGPRRPQGAHRSARIPYGSHRVRLHGRE
jgi:hypothetical protein